MKFTQAISVLLALLMLLACLVSCKGGNGGGDTSDSVSDVVPDETQDPYTYDENGYINDTLADDLDFGSTNINMLHWSVGGEYIDELSAEESTNPIRSATYFRIKNVEERLNCYISISYERGDWDSRADFVSKVYNNATSGDTSYDIISYYSFAAPIGVMYGLHKDLNKVSNLDLDMPWWIQDLNEGAAVDGKLYFATGDIAPTVVKATYCMFFNADELDVMGYKSDDLYKMALEGGWTMEKMKEMVKGTYQNSNNNTEADVEDFFGLTISDNVHYDALFYAAGMRIIDRNADGSLSLSRNFTGDRTATLVEEWKALLKTNDIACIEDRGVNFAAGNSLFLLKQFDFALTGLTESTMKYGVLPLPKYDDSQEKYGSCLGAWHSVYAITSTTKKTDMAGAVMEALASDAYRHITPAIYEDGLKLKYSQDANDGKVYDIIRASVITDIGRIWGDQIKVTDTGFGLFRNAIRYERGWSSEIASHKGGFVEDLELIVSTVESFNQ